MRLEIRSYFEPIEVNTVHMYINLFRLDTFYTDAWINIFILFNHCVISQSLFALTLPRKTMIGGRQVDKYLGEMLQITFVHVHVLSNDQPFLSYEQSGFKKKQKKQKILTQLLIMMQLHFFFYMKPEMPIVFLA